MGNEGSVLEEDRNIHTHYEKVTKKRKLNFWKTKEYQSFECNRQEAGRGTLSIDTILKSIPFIQEFHQTHPHVRFLEVGSGNGYNTHFIVQHLNEPSWIATDMKIHEPSYFPIERLLSHKAVQKYANQFEVLVLVSPIPKGYMDYYAIKEFELIPNQKEKHIIYIGEMGASDGSKGIYQYMMNHQHWKLKKRKLLVFGMDILGGPVEKEFFLFTFE